MDPPVRRLLLTTLSLVGTLVFIAAAVWALVTLIMWRYQEFLVFPAPGGIDVSALDQSASEVGADPFRLTTDDGVEIYGWMRRPNPDKDRRCAVLYFHGNGDVIGNSAPLGRFVARKGCTFLAIAYRGYPGSGGAPSEEGIARDARALWEHAAKLGFTPDRILLHGSSLGGGVAIRLASEVQPAALVTEATFTSMADVAVEQYPWIPVRTLLRSPFPSLERAPSITAPVLVVHGGADSFIPPAHGRALAAAFPHARYLEIPALGHQELVLSDDGCREAYASLVGWLGQSERPGMPEGW